MVPDSLTTAYKAGIRQPVAVLHDVLESLVAGVGDVFLRMALSTSTFEEVGGAAGALFFKDRPPPLRRG